MSASEGFDIDCPLNDEVTTNLVCGYVCDGDDDATIATNAGITTAYVTKYKLKCPEKCPLSTNEVTSICNMKAIPLDVVTVKSIFSYLDSDLVEAAFNDDCP